MNYLLSLLRSAWRLGAFLGVVSFALLRAAWLARTERRLPRTTRCARWSHYWSPRVRRCLGLTVEVHGRAPDGGMLVSNHVSYLDMLALTAATEMVFLSKAEVRRWPVLGQIARAGGMIFVNRERRADVADLAPAFEAVIKEGVVLTMFPEGTSTGGDRVLPFHSSFLAPAARHGWAVTPAFIRYDVEGGSVESEVAYWRDMTFLPHFLNLLGKRRIRAVVRFGEPLRNSDRKALARDLHRAVLALAQLAPASLNAAPTASAASVSPTPGAAAAV